MLRVTVWDLGKLGDGGTGDTSGGIVDGIAQWGEVSMWVSSGAGDVGVAGAGDGGFSIDLAGVWDIGGVTIDELGSSWSGRVGLAQLQNKELLESLRGGASQTYTRFCLIWLFPSSMR